MHTLLSETRRMKELIMIIASLNMVKIKMNDYVYFNLNMISFTFLDLIVLI